MTGRVAGVTPAAEQIGDPFGTAGRSLGSMNPTRDTIEHPITGERIVFRKRAADTGGELLEMDLFVAPHGYVATPHVHPQQIETFEVVSGRLRFRVGGEERTYGPGERAAVPAKTNHAWWNPFEEEARLLVQIRPALGTETMFETFFGLGRDGKVTSKGMPKPLQLMILLRDYRRETTLPPPISWVVMPVVFLLAPIARRLGYRASYPQYSSRQTPAER